MGTKRISADKSANVYECFSFIWPYNAQTAELASSPPDFGGLVTVNAHLAEMNPRSLFGQESVSSLSLEVLCRDRLASKANDFGRKTKHAASLSRSGDYPKSKGSWAHRQTRTDSILGCFPQALVQAGFWTASTER
jgi:hypothetical protein